MKRKGRYFTTAEKMLWSFSVLLVCVAFFAFDGENYLSLFASVLGVTSLIFSAKGHPVGQLLMVLFSIAYGIIAYSFAYYGEMLTYLLMTAPMALFALISWCRHPYKNNKAQVEVGRLKKGEPLFLSVLTAAVTVVFYFVLAHFNTANLLPSTLSVTTSFVAVYLTFRRSPYYALAYAANDLVLIVLWVMASFESLSYISVTVCFAVFFVNDLYGFVCWRQMKKAQKNG